MSTEAPGLVGYQQNVDWMGSQVLTLADLWPPAEARAMIVGLNPAPKSVEAGHYYQGKSGQRQLGRLAKHGLFSVPSSGSFFEESALAGGIGFLDLVKRPTPGEKDISEAEKEHGRAILARSLTEKNVRLVVCVFRHPVKALLGSAGTPGLQPHRTSWGAQVFRMPSPYEKREIADEIMSTLRLA